MSFKFVQNRACEYFPCHKGIESEKFNCLFCYCPLYLLKNHCGGNYKYLENNVKSCEQCTLPHNGVEGYNYISNKIDTVINLGKLENH